MPEVSVSILIPYCLARYEVDNLRGCLASLRAQTVQPKEILVGDDSHPDDVPLVQSVCEEFGAKYIPLPFTYWAPAWSRKMNGLFYASTGEMVVLLCSNWQLGENWLEEMVKWLEELGRGHIIVCDNARHDMGRADGTRYDWYAGREDRFEEPDYSLLDMGYLHIFYRNDWVDWDEDYDPPPGYDGRDIGAWHAITEWAFQMIVMNAMKLMVRRDLKATHLWNKSKHPRASTSEYLQQTRNSFSRFRQVMMARNIKVN